MVKYQKCSDLKRTFAFLIDIFIAFLIGVVLFTVPSLIFQQTDSYKNNLETINTVKNESGLFKNDQNLDIYLENEDLTRELEDNIKRVMGKRNGEIVCAYYAINGRPEKNTWQIAEENNMTETRVN